MQGIKRFLKDRKKYAYKIIIIYLAFNLLHILIFDIFFTHQSGIIHLIKGLIFVAFATAVFFTIINKLNKQLQKKEEQLAVHEEKLRLALEAGTDGFWEYNVNTKKLILSDKWKVILEYDHEEIPQDLNSLLELVHPEDKDILKNSLQEFSREKVAKHDIKYRVRAKSGEYKWIVSRGQAMYDKTGKLTYFIGTHTEITGSKKRQDEIIKSEEGYRNLIEFLPDAVYLFYNEIILFANSKAAQLIGFENKEDMIGRSIFEFIHPENHRITKERLKLIKNNPDIALPLHERSLLRTDGTLINVEVTTTTIIYNGSVSQVTVFRDISERKKQEQEIIMFYRYMEQSHNSIVMISPQGNIEYANPRFLEVMGFTLKEVKGKLCFDLGCYEHYDDIIKAIRNGKAWKGELRGNVKNGKRIWELVSISPIRNQDNVITNFLAVKEDVTERKLMEEELKNSYLDLEETLNKLKETQTQLIQQEKLAGIGQLAAGIAHEINNPLGFILSNFNTLEKYFYKYKEVMEAYQGIKNHFLANGLLNIDSLIIQVEELEKKNKLDFIREDLNDLFKETNEGIDRVGQIVKGLRVFSRVDSLDEYEDYDINEGIKNTLIVAKNEIKYFAAVEENLKPVPFVQAMGGAINQVILNMLLNSVHAIKEKSIGDLGIIKITTYNDEKNIYLEIEDNGIGIEEKHLSSIFDPFFTTKPVGNGTGLGLSIAYEIIINKHKGDITVESTEGEATKFIVRLPISQRSY